MDNTPQVKSTFKIVTIHSDGDRVKGSDDLEKWLNKGWRISQVSGFNDAIVYILVDETTAQRLSSPAPNRLSVPER